MISERMPPQDLEAEQALLGSMLIHRDAAFDAWAVISPDEVEAFYSMAHRTLWRVLVKYFDSGKQSDLVVIRNLLIQQDLLNEVGGVEYLVELAESVPTHLHAKRYAELVRDKWFARRVIAQSLRLADVAYQNGDPNDLRDAVGGAFTEMSERRSSDAPKDIGDVIVEVFDEIKLAKGGGLRGIETPFVDLNEILGGFHQSELIVLAARPSMGKTAMAMSFLHFAAKLGCPTLFFSVEMRRQDIVSRLMCQLAQVDGNRLRRGIVTDGDLAELRRSQEDLERIPLWIDDTPSIHIMDLTATARSHHRNHKVGLVGIDYLQLVHGLGKDRQAEVADISGRLKGLSRELQIPVLALCQLNRKSEDRADSRPRLSDLRESGAIEQDADVVMLLHRQEYYDKDRTDEKLKGVAELAVEKQRNGPIGTVRLAWNPTLTRFANLTSESNAQAVAALAEMETAPRLPYADPDATPF
jgi:replicative DNA helicase